MIEVRLPDGTIEARSGVEYLLPGDVFRTTIQGTPSSWRRALEEPERLERNETAGRACWGVKSEPCK